MRYVSARCVEANRKMAYRFYVTDGIRLIVNKDAPRYADIVDPKPVVQRSAEDIKADIRDKLGKLGGGNGSV